MLTKIVTLELGRHRTDCFRVLSARKRTVILGSPTFRSLAWLNSQRPVSPVQFEKTQGQIKVDNAIQIVDLFSGPGGLAEGFCSVGAKDHNKKFRVAVSVEKDVAAHKTLTLRSFLRHFDQYPSEYYEWLAGRLKTPDWPVIYPDEWERAQTEVWNAELGNPDTTEKLSQRIEEVQASAGRRTLLIGGPPCQAYSLVGRARNAGIKTYVASDDHRHFLYKEYCRVLAEFSPSVFVMENVKGMLSSSVAGSAIFGAVLNDLESAGDGYDLFALSGADDLLP